VTGLGPGRCEIWPRDLAAAGPGRCGRRPVPAATHASPASPV